MPSRSLFLSLLVLPLLGLLGCGGGGAQTLGSDPTTTTYYGSRINADNLANQVVGWNPANDFCNRKASIRVMAPFSGVLKSIRPKFIWSTVRPGYAAGTGGTIQIQIQTDDGTTLHAPSGTVLASLVYDSPVVKGNYWPLLTYTSPAALSAGTLYHIVFANIDAAPSVNWVSLDHLYTVDKYAQDQPTIPNTDLGALQTDPKGVWFPFAQGSISSFTPTIELDFADGTSFGQGYIQGFGMPDPSFVNPKPITDTQGVREVFTVSGTDRRVDAVSLRVNRVSGTGPMNVRVERADGTLVGQTTVIVPVGDVTSTATGMSWVKALFPNAFTLTLGTAYHLVLSSPTGTVHTAHVLQKGDICGYSLTTFFGDGLAQFNPGTGWTGWDLWGQADVQDTDLQFYFEVLS